MPRVSVAVFLLWQRLCGGTEGQEGSCTASSDGQQSCRTRQDSPAAVDEARLQFRAQAFNIALVSDLDKASRNAKKFSWHSFLRRGVLRLGGGESHQVEWHSTSRLETILSAKNRSMELSELIRYDGKLLAMCDITGLVFEVEPETSMAFQRLALADGNGKVLKPFKSEWATIKDGVLLVGSMGREWVGDQGQIEHFDSQWIKSIDKNGKVEAINWRPVFEALRTASNTSSPGYLWHEAVIWDAWLRRWLVLPRKASQDSPYSPEDDETRGTNLLLIASEDFSEIQVRTLGPLEPEWGFAALRKVPGTNDTYAALKVLEVGDRTETKLAVFDLRGNMLLDPPFQHVDSVKYEGLEFLGEHIG